jgi:hypothetical protein
LKWRRSHPHNRTRRRNEEMVPHDPASLESRPFAYNRSNPGRSARFRNMLYRIFFPRLHHEMRGNFFRCQGSGCMMWRWETKDPPPSEPRKGSPPSEPRKDIVAWQARPTRSLRSDGTARCKAQAPMPLFRHCLGSGGSMPHHRAVTVAESPQLSRNSARQIGK